MATIRPFACVRPNPDLAAEVAAPPYDVVNANDVRQIVSAHPNSFLRITRSEVDLPESIDPYSSAVYQKARGNFENALKNNILIKDQDASLYIYRLSTITTSGVTHSQIGIVGVSSVKEYNTGVIKIHEKTKPDKEDDRVRHITAVGAQCGPAFLVFESNQQIDTLINEQIEQTPLYDFTADDSVRHTVWKAGAATSEAICTAYAKIPCVYIADGHHRAKSASRICERVANDLSHPAQYFLAVSFPTASVQILPYNRVIKKLPMPSSEILNRIEEAFTIEKNASPTPKEKGYFNMFIDGQWYGLTLRKATHSCCCCNHGNHSSNNTDPVSSLDVSILQDKILSPIFGIADPRTDPNIDFVGGSKGTKELERMVINGEAQAAFSLYPVSIKDLIDVADAGKLMPPKSTWFEPKLKSGLFVYEIGDL